jgi:hypothetical protein
MSKTRAVDEVFPKDGPGHEAEFLYDFFNRTEVFTYVVADGYIYKILRGKRLKAYPDGNEPGVFYVYCRQVRPE